MECVNVTSGVPKAKKKQVKHELDRTRQAEKKKRRLEKALATSAAIISELEEKKQRKKEEQERLDSEGAAIAEAVALHVLLGEDSDDSRKVMLKKDEGPTSWDHGSNTVPYQDFSNYSLGNIEWVSDTRTYGDISGQWGNLNLMVSSDGDFYPKYFRNEGFVPFGSVGLSAGPLAAQAVSSLKIADEARIDAYVFNHMLRG